MRDPTHRKVVADEEGCMLYQLVKNKDGEYFVLELYKDQAALDTHFKNMGAPGAIPLEKIKEGSPLQIYPVVGGFLHEGESTVANIVTLPIAEGKAADFEAATIPALGAFDGEEPGTHAYLLCKKYDESMYFFLELFADQAAIELHGGGETFAAMGKRQGAAKANDRSRKAKFAMGMSVCTSTTRKVVAHSLTAKL
eukprot:COSAG06_NODE_5165_length_3667_cov_7.140975_2_plen_196_part_00